MTSKRLYSLLPQGGLSTKHLRTCSPCFIVTEEQRALSLQATYLAQCLLTSTEVMMRKVKKTKGTVLM